MSGIRRLLKTVVFFLCLTPLGVLMLRAVTGGLSANPISDITHETGIWTLRFLVIVLSISPIRMLSGWSGLTQFRRMIGLFAFAYVCLHFTTYIWLDKFFDVQEMFRDVSKRKFITIGFTSFLLLIPLAVTSTNGMIRRLGGKRWKKLHRLVYAAAIGGVVHYVWLVKADIRRPLTYGVVVALLLGYRAARWTSSRLAHREPEVNPGTGSALEEEQQGLSLTRKE